MLLKVITYSSILKICKTRPTKKYCNNIYKILFECFDDKFIVSYFQKKVYCGYCFKKHIYILKMTATAATNDILVGLLIIAGGIMLLN